MTSTKFRLVDSVEVLKRQVNRLEDCNSDLKQTKLEIAEVSSGITGGLDRALRPVITELRSLRKSLVFTLCGMFLVCLGTLSALLVFLMVSKTGGRLISEKTKDGWHHEFNTDQKK